MDQNRMAGMAEQFMSSWQSDIFRERCAAQIETVRSQTNPRLQKEDPVENFLAENTSTQLEEFVFHKSKTREEYMSLVSEMIMMLREHAGKPPVDMSVLERANPGSLQAAGMSKEELGKFNEERQNGKPESEDGAGGATSK